MPTYHYKCKACEREFEEFQGMSEDPLTRCPACGKKKLIRLISGSGLVFKGSGFYLTDYKNKGASAATSSKEKKPPADVPAEKPGPSGDKKEKGKSSSGPPSGEKT
ncbi:MAG TPA: zinc ribbon domain-containing protein [Bacteroidota bacterium]|nr:zinc ribbon domain-containing protein [Bacteroidota bacterium]